MIWISSSSYSLQGCFSIHFSLCTENDWQTSLVSQCRTRTSGSLFFRISTEKKNSLAVCLMELMEKSTEDKKEEWCIRSSTDPSTFHNATLKDFVTSSSLFFFNALLFSTDFLVNDASTWLQNPSFQNVRKVVSSLTVINDCAERGIALASSFNSSLTKSEEEKQYLLQVVEQHRKEFPDTKKLTVLKSSQIEHFQDSGSSD